MRTYAACGRAGGITMAMRTTHDVRDETISAQFLSCEEPVISTSSSSVVTVSRVPRRDGAQCR